MIRNKKILGIACLFLIILLGIRIHTQIWNTDLVDEDIYYIWLEGKRLLAGENPYTRVLLGNMRENDKYATYFPLFYYLSSLIQWLGFQNFLDWLEIWQPIFLLFNLGITALLFFYFYNQNLLLLGIFSSLFWLINRWTIYITEIGHIEFIPIFF